MPLKVNAKLNTAKLDRLERRVTEDSVSLGSGPFRRALRECGRIYFRAMQERHRLLRKGGGLWPALAAATVEARRTKRRKGKRGSGALTDILLDSGTLFRVLEPTWGNRPGKLCQDIPGGVRVGYGGAATHPEATNLTISELARIQHFGANTRYGRIPPRPLIVAPSSMHVSEMQSVLKRALRQYGTDK